MTQVKKIKALRSGMSLALVLAMLFSVVVFFPIDANADVATERKMIKWHRVYTQADIKSGPMLLCWGGSGTRDYVSVGGYEWGWSMVGSETAAYSSSVGYGLNEFLDEFYTFADEVTNYWTIEFLGKYDSCNNNIKKCHLRLPRQPGEGGGYIWNKYKFHLFESDEYNLELGWGSNEDSDFDWSISTHNSSGGKYEKKTGYGFVQIFHECSGKDDELYGNGNKISCRGNSSYDYYDFVMYIGEEVTATEYSSFTIRSGQTFAMEGISTLGEYCTILIEPGAVLRVSDLFINNGTIRNYGMYLIDENAVVSTYGFHSVDAGSVYIYGQNDTTKGITGQTLTGEGNMIVLRDAVYATTKEYTTIRFKEGSSLHLNGLMSISGYLEFNGSEVVIGDTGSLLVSYDFTERVAGDGKSVGRFVDPLIIGSFLYPMRQDGSPGEKTVAFHWIPYYGKNKNELVTARLKLKTSQSYVRVEGKLLMFYSPNPLDDNQTRGSIGQKVENRTNSIIDLKGSGEAYYIWYKK